MSLFVESVWASIKIECLSKCCIMLENSICSITVEQVDVTDSEDG